MEEKKNKSIKKIIPIMLAVTALGIGYLSWKNPNENKPQELKNKKLLIKDVLQESISLEKAIVAFKDGNINGMAFELSLHGAEQVSERVDTYITKYGFFTDDPIDRELLNAEENLVHNIKTGRRLQLIQLMEQMAAVLQMTKDDFELGKIDKDKLEVVLMNAQELENKVYDHIGKYKTTPLDPLDNELRIALKNLKDAIQLMPKS